MQRRSVANTIELDQSLRSARSYYSVASVFAVPSALISMVWLISDIGALISASESAAQVSWDIFLDVVIIGFAYVVVSQVVEANRRIRTLVNDPSANVKPIYIPKILQSP